MLRVPSRDDRFVYAGFWRRAIAWLIDWALVLAVSRTLFKITPSVFGISVQSPIEVRTLFVVGLTMVLIAFAWAYWAVMEISRFQGTLGKMMLGI